MAPDPLVALSLKKGIGKRRSELLLDQSLMSGRHGSEVTMNEAQRLKGSRIPIASCGPPVFVDHAAEHVLSFNPPTRGAPGLGRVPASGRGQVQPSMWPLLRVVTQVGPEHSF